MNKYRIRKGDVVKVIAGKDAEAGKVGKVLKILKKSDRVLVEKVNMAKRNVKPNPYKREPGGIVDKEMPIHVSNVMVVPILPNSNPCRVQNGKRQKSSLL